jgi:methyl-accepting chemotaxis protein
MEQLLISKLSKWADENPGDQAEFLREAAAALGDSSQRAAWSFVDIPSEIEQRAATRSGVASWVRALSLVSFLVPIFLTWFHLRSAASSFREVAERLEPGQSLDFLAFWSGASSEVGSSELVKYSGTTLPATAAQVLYALVLIIGLQLWVSIREPREKPAVSPVLRDLALQAQLAFFQSRSITPREVVDAMGEAANQLSETLSSTRESLGSIEEVAAAVVGSATTLNQVSESLRTSADSIANGVAPLVNLPQQLNEIVRAMENAADSLTETQGALASTTNSVVAVMGASKSAADDAARMSEATRDVLAVVTKAQTLVAEVAASIKEAAVASQKLGVVVTEHEPHVAILDRGVKAFLGAVEKLESIANEFKYSADRYAEVNESHRKQTNQLHARES